MCVQLMLQVEDKVFKNALKKIFFQLITSGRQIQSEVALFVFCWSNDVFTL